MSLLAAFLFLNTLSLRAQTAGSMEEVQLLFDQGNFVAALSKSDALLATDTNNANILLLSGRIRMAMKDIKGAEFDLEKAVSIDQNNAEALLNHGIVLFL